MIKKLFAIFLAIIYFSVSSGATLHLQYCMGRLVKITLWHGEEKKRYACGMERMAKRSKNCCKDQHIQFKSEKSGSVTLGQVKVVANAVALFIQPVRLANSFCTTAGMQRPISKAPPPGAVVPVFLRNCTFLI